MRCFVRTLQYWGFEPEGSGTTDGSNLYPAVLAELWPAAKQQLCVFHVLQDVLNQVLAAVHQAAAPVRPTVARAVASVVVVGEPKEEHGSGDAGRQRTRRRRPSCTGTGS